MIHSNECGYIFIFRYVVTFLNNKIYVLFSYFLVVETLMQKDMMLHYWAGAGAQTIMGKNTEVVWTKFSNFKLDCFAS
jgi:hypothetical protein